MFVAVWPDDGTQERLSSLRLKPAQGLRLVEPGQWHITLRFLGDVDEQLVPSLIDALGSGVRRLVVPVHCEVGPSTAWFNGDRILQIPVAGLDATAGAVRSATIPVIPGRVRGEPQFQGHLTIARSMGRGPDVTVRTALAGLPFFSTFPVDDIHLVASHVSAEGTRYSTLERVPLPR